MLQEVTLVEASVTEWELTHTGVTSLNFGTGVMVETVMRPQMWASVRVWLVSHLNTPPFVIHDTTG